MKRIVWYRLLKGGKRGSIKDGKTRSKERREKGKKEEIVSMRGNASSS